VDKAVLNTTSNVFTFGNDVNDPGANTCINGDCTLPGETNVVIGCSVSLSVFTVDYDAPTCNNATNVRTLFQPLANNPNVTTANGVNGGNGTITTPAPVATQSTNAASGITPQNIAALVGIIAMMMLM
jgi:5'/3'-nucleotidase